MLQALGSSLTTTLGMQSGSLFGGGGQGVAEVRLRSVGPRVG